MKLTRVHRKIMVAFLFAAFTAVATTARCENVLDIEYMPTSDYGSVLGVGFYQSKPESFGLYGNFQRTIAFREPKYESLNISSFGDPVIGLYKDIMLLNIGVTRQIYASVIGYAGIGFASVKGIARKYDPLHILASDGEYYVDYPAYDESGGNLNVGIIFGIKKVVFNLGYQSYTSNAYLGVGFRF